MRFVELSDDRSLVVDGVREICVRHWWNGDVDSPPYEVVVRFDDGTEHVVYRRFRAADAERDVATLISRLEADESGAYTP